MQLFKHLQHLYCCQLLYTLLYNGSAILNYSHIRRTFNGIVYASVVYSAPTIIWLSPKHILYIIIVMIFYTSLVFIPSLLLCVYPTRIYRCLSQFLSARKRLAITAFVEALHNCFKDGLNGTRDYRALVGIVLFGGIMLNLFVKNIVFDIPVEVHTCFWLIFLSFFFSYLRPCKLTIANLSLNYHLMVAGILSIALHLWKYDMSTGTEPLELAIIVLPAISHILMFVWAGYIFVKWIMSHCGYQFNTCDFKAALSDLANAAKQHFHRGRGGYQVLANAAAQ